MADYQIQRILHSQDLSSSVQQQIQQIQHFTQELSNRSTFMNVFQQMLKKELQCKNACQVTETSLIAAPSHHQNDTIDSIELSMVLLPQQMDTMREQIHRLREDTSELSRYFGGYIQEMKHRVIDSLKEGLSVIANMLESKYQRKLMGLVQQNQLLMKMIEQYNKNSTALTYHGHAKGVLKENKGTQQTAMDQSKIVNRETRWTDYHFSINATRRDANQIPLIRMVTVGVSPVQQGFGVIKCNDEVVYKGMWRDGRFHGKGSLKIDQCLYEGEFQNNKFCGLGTLTTQFGTYRGMFRDHKAEGEGTWRVSFHKPIIGLWKSNKLVSQY